MHALTKTPNGNNYEFNRDVKELVLCCPTMELVNISAAEAQMLNNNGFLVEVYFVKYTACVDKVFTSNCLQKNYNKEAGTDGL